MKKTQRLRIIQGLRIARDIITKINCSVGTAIRRQGKIYGESINFNPTLRPKDIKYLIDWMDDMLDGQPYLEKWLRAKGLQYTGEGYLSSVRLNWIDWMISEMEREG